MTDSRASGTIFGDDAVSLLTRGYGLGAHVWERVRPGARSAPMRLLGDDALLVRGEEAVALFYDEQKVARHGAMPAIVQQTLFGQGSVHSLDGDPPSFRMAGRMSRPAIAAPARSWRSSRSPEPLRLSAILASTFSVRVSR